ncbi:LLM class flavin-dependent oxidoreductase [Mycetocola sp.]|jgi:FMN-dependent oxidoreductase (nitrilotriacetate monooxygenase family)|uniref:LLM class flavin-dependent oxidoreductase n=1 Tax=Mycetocola sp. TaxID=1871042 RepID=UPI00262EC763|nr:LLM class flavin-dependent oxidoreductase [Mycetocola sp.]MCU1561121.1 FMN-dependent monooxygenase [Mycetocola sp.]
MPRHIRFNAFDMNCVAHQSPGLWRHPDDQSHRYTDLSYWTELAKLLERGKFDGLFIADVLGTYDVYGGNHDAALRNGAQVPVSDPLLLVSAMAAVTENLGFGITAGTAYEHPYPFARRLSTLDHLTKGRIGWNVVTGYLPSAARNMGHDDQIEHDERYNIADEYLEVLYKLWEGSWEDDAVVRDRESGVFTDPAKVHEIAHAGKNFTVPGIHLSEPSPQRTPVIFQAGASGRGVTFAAENAEAIFVGSPTKAILKNTVAKIRDALEAAGRDRYAAKIYQLVTVITDETPEKAQAKHEDYQQYASTEGALVFMSGWMGIDLSQYDLDAPIGDVKSNAIQSTVANFQSASEDGSEWTVRDIASWAGIGGLGTRIVGSGSEVADQLQSWVDETDVDGFNLAYAITPGSFEDIVEFVIPELQARGAYPTDYAPGSFRNKLHGRGDRLPEEHRGASFSYRERAATS